MLPDTNVQLWKVDLNTAQTIKKALRVPHHL